MDVTATALWEAMKPSWPSNTEVNETPHRSLVITFLTLDDPARPGKRSREVELDFTEDTLASLDAAQPLERAVMAQRAALALKRRLKHNMLWDDNSEPLVFQVDRGWIAS